MNKLIKQLRKKKNRIRTIFKELQNIEKYSYWSDLILLNIIVNTLIEEDLKYSKQEINSTFKLVDKEDYRGTHKDIILKPLLKKAEEQTVFHKKAK